MDTGLQHRGDRFILGAIAVIGTAFIAFHLYTAVFGVFIAQLQRTVHISFAAVLAFFISAEKRHGAGRLLDLLLALLAALSFGYLAFHFEEIALRQTMVTPLGRLDLVMGGICLIMVLELTRRIIGWALAIVALLFLLYVFAGPYLPMVIAHRGYSFIDAVDFQVFSIEGIFSIPVGVSATYIILFIILGTLLEYTGTGDLIMDLGKLIAGRSRGGPAKIASISSAFFGSISGSAAANVYATGSLTIPMMRRIGYKPRIAGAVEAVASTGGQIMPPVMGAAAFLMSDLLGIPYIQICKAALVPAVLYFATLLLILDFEAAKTGIRGMDRAELPRLADVLPRLYLLLPLAVLVAVLVMGFTPFRAAFIAIVITFAVSFLKKETRFTPRSFLQAIVTSARRGVMIAIACAAAGIVIGVIMLTGLGLSFSGIIISFSGGKVFLALLLIMVASIIMGMGTPTTVAYVIVATLAVPVLDQLGFPTLASHLFVFYFGVLSMITPPVAVSAYAAAEIAGEDAMRIALTATRIGAIAFMIPFVFIYEQALLLNDAWWRVVIYFFTTLLAGVFLAGSVSGWLLQRIGILRRAFFLVLTVLIIFPDMRIKSIGVVAGLLLLIVQWLAARRPRQAASV
jgi:TRAP transporter 4TM/12TM fusion protein